MGTSALAGAAIARRAVGGSCSSPLLNPELRAVVQVHHRLLALQVHALRSCQVLCRLFRELRVEGDRLLESSPCFAEALRIQQSSSVSEPAKRPARIVLHRCSGCGGSGIRLVQFEQALR